MGSLRHDLIGTWRLLSRIDRNESGGMVEGGKLVIRLDTTAAEGMTVHRTLSWERAD